MERPARLRTLLKAGIFVLVCLFAAFSVPLRGLAQTSTTWNGATGAWNVSANWTNGLPYYGVDALITNPNSNVTIQTVNSVSNGGARSLTLGSGNNLYLAAGMNLSVFGANFNNVSGDGVITNNGTITLYGNNSIFGYGSLTLAGSGTLIMDGAGTSNIVPNSPGPGTLINGITIQGAGTIGETNIVGGGNLGVLLTNSGTITGNQSNALNLILNDGSTNSGTIQASSTGELNITQTGALTNASGGYIQAAGGLLTISGNIVNQGTMQATNGTLNLAASPTITNSGIIQANNGGSVLFGISSTISNAGGTISASGGHVSFGTGFDNTGGTIGASAGGIVDFGGGTFMNGSLTAIGSGSLIRTSGTITNMAIAIGQGAGLQVNGGTLNAQGAITNNGAIALNGSATLSVGTGSVTLSGSGTLTMDSSGSSQIIAGSGGALVNGTGHTIQGAGQIGVWPAGIVLTNNGTINASQANNAFNLYLNPGSTNSGTMQATAGGGGLGGLNIYLYPMSGSSFSGTLTNTGSILASGGHVTTYGNIVNQGAMQAANGTLDLMWSPSITNSGAIQANTGGTVNFAIGSAVDNTGGTIGASGGGHVNLAGGTFTGGSLTGSGSNTYIYSGGISNSGSATLIGVAVTLDQAVLQVDSGKSLNLTGSGVVTLSNLGAIVSGGGTPGTLVNDTNYTIHGAGQIGGGTSGIVLANSGTIAADQSSPLSLYVAPGSTNSGTMQATSTGGLYINATSGSFTNTGTLHTAAGSVMTVTGNFTNYASGTLTGGTYDVAGALWLPVPAGQTIQANAATIVLDGPHWQISGQNGSNALAGLATNASGGSFTVTGGAGFLTAGAFTNAGSMAIGVGSAFLAGSLGSQAAYTQTGGSTTVNGALQAGSVSIQGGTLSGTGGIILVGGPLTVSSGATVHPGNSPGILTVNGAYSNAGTLAIDILNHAGGAGTGYSQLVVNSSAVTILGGTLQINILTGAVLNVNEQFDIVHAPGGLSGTFASVTGDSSYFNLDYEANDVYLVANQNVTPTPIPPGIFLLGGGLAGLCFARRRMGRKV